MSKSKKKKQPNSSKENRKDSSISTHKKKTNVKKHVEENRNKPETKKNMEFYHPHGNHQNRNFKDYISEFIMIFIAITGGFFMENMREHVVEHHKEKEYIVRLIRDIKQDTTDLKYFMQWNKEQMQELDSLRILIDKPVSSIDPDKFIALLSNDLNDCHLFTPRDITMSQLKNTGGLRLIENSTVSDSIVIYYNTIENSILLGNANSKFMDESFQEEMKFIDFNEIIYKGKLKFFDINKLRGLRNRCAIYKIQIGAYNRNLKNIYNQAVSLLIYLQKEYNLNNNES